MPGEPTSTIVPGTSAQTDLLTSPGTPPVVVHLHNPGPAASPGQAPGGNTEDWEKRFKGLTTVHQQLVADTAAKEEELQKQLIQLTSQNEEAAGKLGVAEQQSQEAAQALEGMKLQIALLEAEQTKAQLLATKAPGLAHMSQFIPHVSSDGTIHNEEELTKLVDSFVEKMSAMTDGAIQGYRQGHVPTPPGAQTRDPALDADAQAAWLERNVGEKGQETESAKRTKLWRTTHPGT